MKLDYTPVIPLTNSSSSIFLHSDFDGHDFFLIKDDYSDTYNVVSFNYNPSTYIYKETLRISLDKVFEFLEPGKDNKRIDYLIDRLISLEKAGCLTIVDKFKETLEYQRVMMNKTL